MSDDVKPQPNRNISLTLTSKYASSWGTWEGIRELVQNWHDGVFDVASDDDTGTWFDNKLIFKQLDQKGCHFISYLHNQKTGEDINVGRLFYDQLNDQLVLINSGTALKKKILLLGFSAKSNKHEVIGQFGEGLKVGALALVRNGYSVVMETSTDQWKFDLLHSDEFEENVLTVVVSDRIKEFSYGKICTKQLNSIELSESDTCTIVGGLTFQEWKKILPRFLFLKPPEDCVHTELGTLLLDTALAGQLYVKGLWVADLKEADLSAGVNFSTLQLDRDRNAVPKPSEIDHLMSAIWIKSLEKNPALIKRYFHLLQNDKYRDVRHAAQYSTDNMASMIAEEFIRNYGDNAIPVLNSTRCDILNTISTDLNKTAVLCNSTLLDILIKSGVYTSVEEALNHHKFNQRKYVPYFSLSEEFRGVLQRTTDMIKIVDQEFTLSMVDVMITDQNEKCWLEGGMRVVVPYWMLHKDKLHSTSKFCQSCQHCFCREVYICQSILNISKFQKINEKSADQPLVDVSSKQITVNGQILYIIHELLNNQVQEKNPKISRHHGDLTTFDKPRTDASSSESSGCVGQNKPFSNDKESVSTISVEEVVKRENLYMEQISKLQEQLKEEKNLYSKNVSEIQKELKKIESQLMSKEIGIIDAEQSVRAACEAEIKSIQNKAAKSVMELQRLLKTKDDMITNMKQEIQHKEKKIQQQLSEIENLSASNDRKTQTLIEDLSHYIQQHRNRTESLSRVCAEKSRDKNTENKDKWKLLSELCNSILEDLQREKCICVVCKIQRKSHVIQPCGHYSFCEQCVHQLKTSHRYCPICNQYIDKYIRIYE